jgi:signal transduction histidine kinase
MISVGNVLDRLREYVRPIPDRELRDLHQHTLDGIRSMAICLAILAPCGITYSLSEMMSLVWSRQAIALPVHLTFYALLAAVAKRDFGRRHTSLLLALLAFGISADMTIGMAWITPNYRVFILANLAPMFIAVFVPWRPLLTIGLGALPITGILATHAILDIPLSYPQSGVVASGVSLAIASAVAIQGQRRLWLRFEHARLQIANAELVAKAQSAEASRRTADIRRILDNVDEGFLRLGLDGRMSEERSAILARWFGPPDEAMRFVDCLRRVGVADVAQFEMSWEQLASGIFPISVAIDQLPKRIVAGPRTFAVRYHPMLEGDDLHEVIVVIADVTAQMERERAESELRDLLGALKSVLKDREAFTEFAREAGTLVDAITTQVLSRPLLLRQLHTLKGNTALFELVSVSRLCHDIETRMLGGEDGLAETDRARLIEVWKPIATLVGFEAGDPIRTTMLDVDDAEQAEVMRLLRERAPHADIAGHLLSWRLEPARRRLTQLARRTKATAVRLEKGSVDVVVDHGGVRLPDAPWAPLWTALVHVVRNALDHGIEAPDERIRMGKPPGGVLRLRTAAEGDHLVVEISDDGRGIDWEPLRAKAARRGMPHTTREDLEEVLFADGISSRDEVTELSGRGVGMGAVREACASLGGTIAIDSAVGAGTRITMRLPRRSSPAADRGAGCEGAHQNAYEAVRPAPAPPLANDRA